MRQYLNLLQKILDEGVLQNNRTGIPAYSIVGEMLSFDMNDGFPAITTKKLAFNQVKGELLGFIRGYTNAADFRKLGCNIWDQNANENESWLKNPARKGTDDLGCIYGSIWRNWNPRRQPTPKLREGLPKTYLNVGTGVGGEGHPLKKTWEGMMARCYDRNSVGYKGYGGKGVYVCDAWLEFEQFAKDVVNIPGWELKKDSPESFAVQLDKDLRGDGYSYSPTACCWISAKDNNNLTLKKTYVVEKDGVEFSFTNVSDFCKQEGIEAKNFSDLWTGNKGAKTRSGFKLIDVSEPLDSNKTIDQLANAVNDVIHNPTSRRIKVEAWNAAQIGNMALPPCHTGFQLYVNTQDNELSMTMNQRSCDMFLGIPFNIASYALLLHIIAEATGRIPRHLKMFLTDCHIYENHVEQVKEQLTRQEFSLPQVSITKYSNDFSPIEYIERLEPEDIHLIGYECHPAIKAPMAV